MKIELDTIESRIDRYWEDHSDKPRPHLGISLSGKRCDRAIWLSFRWAVIEKFSGRILRLFNRGHREEDVMSDSLRKAGLDLRKTGFDQVRVDFGSHVSGSIDGIIVSGVPEVPEKPHIWENKTSNEKSFNELEKNGVEKAKPEHWSQIQGYMLGTFEPVFKEKYGFGEIDRALYTVVNKNDDQIYVERVRLEKTKAKQIIERLKRIATEDRIPAPISTDPSWYECKFCSAHELCHITKKTKEVNCRTCAHSTAEKDGTWTCALHNGIIPEDFQYKGCRSHVVHPDLVPWKIKEGIGNSAVYEIDGKDVINGEDGIDSRELIGHEREWKEESGEIIEWPIKN